MRLLPRVTLAAAAVVGTGYILYQIWKRKNEGSEGSGDGGKKEDQRQQTPSPTAEKVSLSPSKSTTQRAAICSAVPVEAAAVKTLSAVPVEAVHVKASSAVSVKAVHVKASSVVSVEAIHVNASSAVSVEAVHVNASSAVCVEAVHVKASAAVSVEAIPLNAAEPVSKNVAVDVPVEPVYNENSPSPSPKAQFSVISSFLSPKCDTTDNRPVVTLGALPAEPLSQYDRPSLSLADPFSFFSWDSLWSFQWDITGQSLVHTFRTPDTNVAYHEYFGYIRQQSVCIYAVANIAYTMHRTVNIVNSRYWPIQRPTTDKSLAQVLGPLTPNPTETQKLFYNVAYRRDMHNIMRATEVNYRPAADYIDKQPQLTTHLRSHVINIMVEVSQSFELRTETVFRSVSLLDRYLSVRQEPQKDLLIVAMTCLMVAAKYEENLGRIPSIRRFAEVTGANISKIKVFERCVLRELDFDIGGPTSHTFMEFYLTEIGKDDEELEHCLSTYLLELSLVYAHHFFIYKPSKVAAAAVCFANFKLENDPWPEHLAEASGYAIEELGECLGVFDDVYNWAKVEVNLVVKYKDPKDSARTFLAH